MSEWNFLNRILNRISFFVFTCFFFFKLYHKIDPIDSINCAERQKSSKKGLQSIYVNVCNGLQSTINSLSVTIRLKIILLFPICSIYIVNVNWITLYLPYRTEGLIQFIVLNGGDSHSKIRASTAMRNGCYSLFVRFASDKTWAVLKGNWKLHLTVTDF